MEVTSKGDLVLYIIMKAPLFLALALLAYKLSPGNSALLSGPVVSAIYIGLTALYLYQVYHIWRVNKSVLEKPVAPMHRYKFSQVAVLNINYLATFGSELAVISMLPMFFMDTFDLSMVTAGLLASGFAFMNLIARPGGGYLSDKLGRKRVLVVCLGGATLGYLGLSQITSEWAVPLAVLLTMACSFFVQAGEGAVFAMVPLVKRRLTGQVAGMVGAYGSVGAVIFLTVLSFVAPSVFFMTIAAVTAFAMVLTQFVLKEPKGAIAEVLPDGTIELIEVG
jgi:NNP family nitrate/nitrite transporter-like MFS transporter